MMTSDHFEDDTDEHDGLGTTAADPTGGASGTASGPGTPRRGPQHRTLPPHVEPAIGEHDDLEATLAESGGGGTPGRSASGVSDGSSGELLKRAESDGDDDAEHLMRPLVSGSAPITGPSPPSARSRKNRAAPNNIDGPPPPSSVLGRGPFKNPCPRRGVNSSGSGSGSDCPGAVPARRFQRALLNPLRSLCDRNDYLRETLSNILRSTLTVMNFVARLLLWCSVAATMVGVVWYSRELKLNGTDPHLIAWFSAGAFVLLGFPLSIYGIFMHLSHYYQPQVQCYVVRILWMVPIYSIESWLCLRFHHLAVYIETLRDCYESFVLYSFLQFLIEVLGGEEALIMTLKDKSPTRGHHIWGMQWCVKPWLMGQPVSRIKEYESVPPPSPTRHMDEHVGNGVDGAGANPAGSVHPASGGRTVKRVQWTSPFLVKCKYGVLQYVVLKFFCSFLAMILELFGVYHEGDFSPKGAYFYICFLTNLSQCWALYCLVFFYNATKNELGPIRPIGKFLSVKALVFFTWWQSVAISILFQLGMIPNYGTDVEDKHYMTPEEVAKGLQDYLICIEMFIGAIVHMFVFPHTDYLQPLGIVKHGPQVGLSAPGSHYSKRLGRKGRHWNAALSHQIHRGDDRSACSKTSSVMTPVSGSGGVDYDLEIGGMEMGTPRIDEDEGGGETGLEGIDAPDLLGGAGVQQAQPNQAEAPSLLGTSTGDAQHPTPAQPLQAAPHPHPHTGFVRAFLDSTIPRDVIDHSVGIVKGDFTVERKTLLHHATTSDEYDLFSSKRRKKKVGRGRTSPAVASGATVSESKSKAPGSGNAPPVAAMAGVPTTKCAKEQD